VKIYAIGLKPVLINAQVRSLKGGLIVKQVVLAVEKRLVRGEHPIQLVVPLTQLAKKLRIKSIIKEVQLESAGRKSSIYNIDIIY
jgi:hypothetical protein